MTPSIDTEIERYLQTGRSDPRYDAWPSESYMARARLAREDLRGALVAEVLRRSKGAQKLKVPSPEQIASLTRRKTAPMIRGLFPRAEQNTILDLIERSVVFLTPANLEAILRKESFDHAAWDIANLYLGSIRSPLLGTQAPHIVGLSQEATCYVSPVYFAEEDPFEDFVVHEVAHIFHNCRRETIGLPFTRGREWLLDIAFNKREIFAYACEAFARVAENAHGPADRARLARDFGDQFTSGDESVVPVEVADILQAAAVRRNGWKVILARCAPPKRTK